MFESIRTRDRMTFLRPKGSSGERVCETETKPRTFLDPTCRVPGRKTNNHTQLTRRVSREPAPFTPADYRGSELERREPQL